MFVYGLWSAVGAYEGAEVCLGIFSDYVKAREVMLAKGDDGDLYISKIELDKVEDNWAGDAIGELV